MAHEQDRQRKLQRKAQKAAKRRQRTRRDAIRVPLSQGALRGLDEAEELLEDGQCEQAVEVLEELGRRYPRRIEVLALLAEAYLKANDLWSYQATCERLTIAAPDQPESWLALAAAAVANFQPAATLRAFSHLATAWPDHPEALGSSETRKSLYEFLAAEYRRRGLDDEMGFRVLLLHDEINLHLHRGKLDKVCGAAARLLEICPTFAPALNNRSEAHLRSGRYAEAIADSRRVLQFDATNYHALANLTRYLYLSGQFDEAQASAVALKACEDHEPDAFLKKAETFAILGDWEAVRQSVYEGQEAWGKTGSPGLAEHLAGVALANLGDLSTARKHWRRAANGPDAVAAATKNLKDSKRPPGERHGPWAFSVDRWLSRGVIEELSEALAEVRREDDVTRVVQRHFERYPQLELLADALFERGGPDACEWLIRLAEIVKRPMLFDALKKFALGERGSDELRGRAMMTLSKAAYVEGPVEMWRDGKRQSLVLTSQEIYSEPVSDLPPHLNDLMASAHQAISRGRGAEAEPLLDEVLRSQPNSVSAQFNRAIAIITQGRESEGQEIVRQIHRDHPDYLFARVQLANECIADGNLEEAKTLLAPITQLKRLHTSEYAAWCSTNINLALAMGDRKAAHSLLSAWEQIDPDADQIRICKDRIDGGGLLSRLVRRSRDAPE